MIPNKTKYLDKLNTGRLTVIVLIAMATSAFLGFSVSSSDTVFAQDENQTQSQDANMTSSFNTTAASTYNEMLNPRQVEYPAHLGFNDLHIEAINHIDPNATAGYDAAFLNIVVHHHCKVYDDMTAACLLFPTGMDDQDKPYGVEYVIPADMYTGLPEEEKVYWHYHKTELPQVHATTPDMTDEELAQVMPVLNETYGKIVYFWQFGDELPIGQPKAVIIEDLVAQAEGAAGGQAQNTTQTS